MEMYINGIKCKEKINYSSITFLAGGWILIPYDALPLMDGEPITDRVFLEDSEGYRWMFNSYLPNVRCGLFRKL